MTQFILLAQGRGAEDWANILFIVIMGVLWLVAGLVKMIAKRNPPLRRAEPEGASGQPRRPAETWQRRLARKAEEIQRRLEEEAGLREPGQQRPAAREAPQRTPQTPGAQTSVRAARQNAPVATRDRSGPQPSTGREHQVARQREAQKAVAAAGQRTTVPMTEPVRRETPEPMMEDSSAIMAAPPGPLKPDEIQQGLARDSGGFEPAAVIDYRDPDALKKAILHYEILGKPLALRDEAAQTSVF